MPAPLFHPTWSTNPLISGICISLLLGFVPEWEKSAKKHDRMSTWLSITTMVIRLHSCSLVFFRFRLLHIQSKTICQKLCTQNPLIILKNRQTYMSKKERKITVDKHILGWFSTPFERVKTQQHTNQQHCHFICFLFFWICSLPHSRLTVPRQWDSALLQGLQSRDTR